MAKKKLLDDIKASPGRFYRSPGDVIRDRRFDDDQRLEILKAWVGHADSSQAPDIRAAIHAAMANLARRAAPKNHAAE